MPLWVGISVAAALFQCWRTALQQKLRGELSVNAAGLVRFLYGVPVGALIVALYLLFVGGSLSAPTVVFVLGCTAGGLLQILGTNLLIMSFGHRGFAVGTAYSKTEVVQSAILALILLGEAISTLAWAGVAICAAGTLYLSLHGRTGSAGALLRATVQPAALCGLGAGLCFSLTAICVKTAMNALDGPDPILRALETVVATNILQTLMQGTWLWRREPAQLLRVFSTWRTGVQVGALSAFGSACWFVGFALAPIALVRAVGQVEILFTLLFSRFFLGERPKRFEILGALVVVGGVVVVLLGR